MKRKNSHTAILYTTVLYLCGFFLFLEWLYPLRDISDTRSITIFVVYALFCFFISIFQTKWWIGFILKGFAMLFILSGLYFNGFILSPVWLEQLLQEFSLNMQALFSQEWYYLTPLFRSFLFLLLIWLMSYLLHYWFVQMKRIFLFILLTFVYITILDTFTVYDASMSIIRTFIISFMALGIANLMKEMDKEAIRFAWIKKSPVWLLPLIGVICFSVMVGFTAPKADPVWPDPVPFIQTAAENAGVGSGAVQKVGYGEDDSRLGGAFIQDDTPVFRVATSEEQYWRIETKDVYTGKGWVNSTEPIFEEQAFSSISLETFHEDVNTTELEAFIEFESNEMINKLVYPYGVSEVYPLEEVELFLDTQSEAIEARMDGSVANLAGYQFVFNSPSYDITKLEQSSEVYPEEIIESYTQLPRSLPDRVGELAEEITAPYDSRYDKVKAIERYFSSNGFEYQTTDVAVPQEDQDYVDQFLFDTKVGYCDNFSTSMVVLLRTLDIPARWVKGFTGGDLIETDPENVYEVTNGNAHSWVEVYFPEVGWVPFEPTQGFSNISDFYVEPTEQAEVTEDDVLQAPEEVEETPEQPAPELSEAENTPTDTEEISAPAFTFQWWHAVIAVALLVIIGFLLYKTRYRWQTRAVGLKLEKNKDAKTFQDAYHHLMKLLNDRGHKKEPDQTLREFAKRIDTTYSTDEMGELTSFYEGLLYKNDTSTTKISEQTQLWQNLIKRIMG